MGFASFIRNQCGRDDPYGDFSKDFLRVEKNSDNLEKGYVRKLENETLYGIYKHLPRNVGTDDIVFRALLDLWKDSFMDQFVIAYT